MLNTQYRMHPSIRLFPSLHFYGNNLIDGPNVISDSYTPVCEFSQNFLTINFLKK